jgi:hypothetical protein
MSDGSLAMTIVTSTHCYKRPPQKRKAVALEVPAIVTKHAPAAAPPHDNDDRKSAIITIRNLGRRGLSGDSPDLTAEEHRRRGDAAVMLFHEVVRRATGKDQP